MNIAVTSAIEDLPPRRPFTVEQLGRMIETGVLAEDERIELIGGDLFVMAAKGYAHENDQECAGQSGAPGST